MSSNAVSLRPVKQVESVKASEQGVCLSDYGGQKNMFYGFDDDNKRKGEGNTAVFPSRMEIVIDFH